MSEALSDLDNDDKMILRLAIFNARVDLKLTNKGTNLPNHRLVQILYRSVPGAL